MISAGQNSQTNVCRFLVVNSVVAKKLGCRLKIKLRQLKEGAKRLMLLAEVLVVPD